MRKIRDVSSPETARVAVTVAVSALLMNASMPSNVQPAPPRASALLTAIALPSIEDEST